MTDHDGASVDRSIAGIIAVAGKGQRAGAIFGDRTIAADLTGEGLVTV